MLLHVDLGPGDTGVLPVPVHQFLKFHIHIPDKPDGALLAGQGAKLALQKLLPLDDLRLGKAHAPFQAAQLKYQQTAHTAQILGIGALFIQNIRADIPESALQGPVVQILSRAANALQQLLRRGRPGS